MPHDLRRRLSLLLLALVAATAASASPSPMPADEVDAEREAAALAFVGEHHPELAALLSRLKPMRPAEYARAVRELAQVSRSLGNLKNRDPRRYELGLELWKARSRVDLLTARLAAGPLPAPELESRLREAVAGQLAVEIRQQRYEREQAEARLRRLSENLKKLEAAPSAVAEGRYQALLKKSQRARRAAANDARPRAAAPDARPAPKSKPKPPVNPNPSPGDRS